jgi:GxxExxY protein
LEICRGDGIALSAGMYKSTFPSHLAHAELTGRILASFHDVAAALGHGFSENVLVRALLIALTDAGMEARCGLPIEVHFRGRCIGRFIPDIVVDRTILIEVKATSTIENYAIAQTLNYLKAAGGGVGLLLNFGRKPESKRLVVGDPYNSLPALKVPPETVSEDGEPDSSM